MSDKNINTNAATKKATVVQAIKAIAVLVVICLVCCLLLSLCNDLFYISDEDKFQRSMSKIYPNFQNDTSFSGALNNDFKTSAEYGEVKSVVKSTDGAYIIEALGNGGYNGGSVTLYVVVGSDALVKSWAVKENVAQSYIGRIPADAGQTWYVGKNVSDALALEMTGATVVATSTAINHAVNMAAYYCRNALGVGKNPEGEAKAAVLALLGADFADYNLESKGSVLNANVNGSKVSAILSDENNTLSYFFWTSGSQGDVQAFVYGTDENQKIVVLTDNGIVKSDNVADDDAIVAKVQSNKIVSFKFGSYTAYAVIIGVDTTNATKTVYTVAGLGIGTEPGTYVLQVSVVKEGSVGKVESIVATTSGYLPGYPSESDTEKLITSLVNTTSATIDGVYTSDKVAGATQSANLITVAVKAVLADFDANVEAGE